MISNDFVVLSASMKFGDIRIFWFPETANDDDDDADVANADDDEFGFDVEWPPVSKLNNNCDAFNRNEIVSSTTTNKSKLNQNTAHTNNIVKYQLVHRALREQVRDTQHHSREQRWQTASIVDRISPQRTASWSVRWSSLSQRGSCETSQCHTIVAPAMPSHLRHTKPTQRKSTLN